MGQRTQIVAELKRALRARGLTYAQVAKHLQLSEASVKRLFAAGDLSLERLDLICELAGLELSELVEEMQRQATPINQLTLAQEQEVVADSKLFLMTWLVLNRWQLDDIVRVYDFTRREALRYLIKLDRLRIIELQPDNRTRGARQPALRMAAGRTSAQLHPPEADQGVSGDACSWEPRRAHLLWRRRLGRSVHADQAGTAECRARVHRDHGSRSRSAARGARRCGVPGRLAAVAVQWLQSIPSQAHMRTTMLRKLLIASICALFAAACSKELPPAPPPKAGTLAIVNARIWTGDDTQPWAQALVIDGARLTVVGANQDARNANAEQVVDAGGHLIVPGFTDAHVHFREGGFSLASVQLRDARTRDEFVARIKAFAATVPAGTWITGGNWDHSLWGGELPTREWIDAVTPDHPVWINRLDGHMSLANSVALKLAGVTRATKDIAGGAIVRDRKGEPTGVLKDNAMTLVDAAVPAPSTEMKDRGLLAAMKYVNEQGVTTVHNMGTWDELETFARAAKAKTLTTRV
jgi:transcriptional regulator with XRE-family HTH domain